LKRDCYVESRKPPDERERVVVENVFLGEKAHNAFSLEAYTGKRYGDRVCRFNGVANV
jgi:hypothetical protein